MRVTNRTDGLGNELERVRISRIPPRGSERPGFSTTAAPAEPVPVDLEAVPSAAAVLEAKSPRPDPFGAGA